MFRIGFDPILEVEQRHEEIIKEMKLIRMATEKMENHKRKGRNSSKLLAMVGRGMASLGATLEARYGEQPDSTIGMERQMISGGCA